MLTSLDVLVGFAVLLLLASLATTTLTQVCLDAFARRGRHLRRGLATLLRGLQPALPEPAAQRIAGALLRHPLVAGPRGGPGAVIAAGELVDLLLRFGAGEPGLDAADERAVRDLLAHHGVTDPVRALAAGTMAAPDLASRIDGWFDTVMDRASIRFTANARWVAAAIAVLLALGLQLDAVEILNALAIQPALRESLVAAAASAEAPANDVPAEFDVARDRVLALRRLATATLLPPPDRWLDEFRWSKLPGIGIAALLVTLGAPFWYSLLRNALKLRPLLARDPARARDRLVRARAPK